MYLRNLRPSTTGAMIEGEWSMNGEVWATFLIDPDTKVSNLPQRVAQWEQMCQTLHQTSGGPDA